MDHTFLIHIFLLQCLTDHWDHIQLACQVTRTRKPKGVLDWLTCKTCAVWKAVSSNPQCKGLFQKYKILHYILTVQHFTHVLNSGCDTYPLCSTLKHYHNLCSLEAQLSGKSIPHSWRNLINTPCGEDKSDTNDKVDRRWCARMSGSLS